MNRWRSFLAAAGVAIAAATGYFLTLDDGRTVADPIGRYRDGRGRFGRGGLASGGSADAGVLDLNGFSIPLALECLTDAGIFVQAPRVQVTVTRGSTAYCTKSDGTGVLIGNDLPRRERLGLLVEPASSNSLVSPRDLTNAAWVKVTMTCLANATGWDGTANGASTCTSTASNGTVLQTLVLASATRSTSVKLKRVTGTGTVSITRDGTTYDDLTPYLADGGYLWVRSQCGHSNEAGGSAGDDLSFNTIDHCASAVHMTSAVLNPVIGLKLATSGDAVAVDFFQDEALSFATSPMSGFSRSADVANGLSTAGLPTTTGELSVDFIPAWTAAIGAGQAWLVDTSNAYSGAGADLGLLRSSGQMYYGFNGSTPAFTQTQNTGHAINYRTSWGADLYVWYDGRVQVHTDAGVTGPTAHTSYAIGVSKGASDYLGGWISRVRWSSAASSTLRGSDKLIEIFGDSIIEAADTRVTDGFKPHQTMSGCIGGRALDRYVSNQGVSANTVGQCAGRMNTETAVIAAAGNASQTVFIWQCGINSLSGADAPATWATALGSIDTARDAGIRVLVSTVTPANGVQDIADFNTLMVAHETDAGYTYANTFHALEDPAHLLYLQIQYDSGDLGHPNSLGTYVMAQTMCTAGRTAGFW